MVKHIKEYYCDICENKYRPYTIANRINDRQSMCISDVHINVNKGHGGNVHTCPECLSNILKTVIDRLESFD